MVFRTSDMEYDSYNEEYYCDQCNRRREKKAIHDYSYKPHPKFKTLSHDEFLTDSDIKELLFGVELEVDKGDDPEELAEEITENTEDIYCKHDGSLHDGVEIVTHPCTLEYHEKELGWDKICEMARDKNFYGQRAGTCGLHIHVGRNQLGETRIQRNQTAAKIIILTKRHWEQLVTFSRRIPRQLDQWAAAPRIDINLCSAIDELIDIALETKRDGRYQAINLANSNTIEFRLWNSTLKPSTIIATLQLTSNICLYAKKHTTEEVLASGWNDITSLYTHKELQNYLKDRGLDNIPRQEPMKLQEDTAQDGTGKMRIGTRVRIINAGGGSVAALEALIGLEATIRHGEKYGDFDYGVEFNEEHNQLHNLDGSIERQTGYWVHASNIEPVTENIGDFLF